MWRRDLRVFGPEIVEISEAVVMGFWDLKAVVVKVKDFLLRVERTEVERYVRGGIMYVFVWNFERMFSIYNLL